jgi:trans-aconitate methyltransferase
VNAAREGVEGPAFAYQWQLRLRRWHEVRRRLLYPQLRLLMDCGHPTSACDLGCGEGSATSIMLSTVFSTCRVTAIDLNRTLLEKCRARFGERVETINMDLRAPKSSGVRYDLILCCNVLMLLDDTAVRMTAQWIGEHLSNDGAAVISIVHPYWTLAANVDGALDPPPEKATFPLGWDLVDADLYYRTVSWYVESLSGLALNIDREHVVTLPANDHEFGVRFRGMAGWPVFWLARVRRALRNSQINERRHT